MARWSLGTLAHRNVYAKIEVFFIQEVERERIGAKQALANLFYLFCHQKKKNFFKSATLLWANG